MPKTILTCLILYLLSFPASAGEYVSPSFMLGHREGEVKLYNNLYTQTAFYDVLGRRRSAGGRQSWNTLFVQLMYGVSAGSRFNMGFDVNHRSVRYGETGESPLRTPFTASGPAARSAVSSFGPKVKFRPFRGNDRLTVQSAFWVPATRDLQGDYGDPYLDYDGFTWYTQFFYDRSWGGRYFLFLEAASLARFGRRGNSNIFSLPLSVFLSRFWPGGLTVFAMSQWAPEIGSGSYYLQTGLGIKYAFSNRAELEAMYTDFIAGISSGAGRTYNLGIRIRSGGN